MLFYEGAFVTADSIDTENMDRWKRGNQERAISITNGGQAMLLIDCANRYIRHVDGSDGYKKQLHWAISAIEKHAGKPLQVEEITCDLLNDYVHSTRDNLASITRRQRRNMICRLVWWACKKRFDRDELAMIRAMRKAPKAWTKKQVKQLYAVACKLKGKHCGIPKRLYWRTYIMVAWDTGLRGCDLRNLDPHEITKDGGFVVIQKKSRKPIFGKMRPKTLKLFRELEKLRGNGPPLRLWCLLSTWRQIAKRIVSNANLPGSIGWLRHSSGTAVELAHPGKGHLFLGNTPKVFDDHYFARHLGLDAMVQTDSLV